MSEPLRKQALEGAAAPATLRREHLHDLLPEIRPAESNDNLPVELQRVGERTGFEIPAWVWRSMVACYALFLAALLFATGGARAAFMIVISAGYVTMFFGLARVMLRFQSKQPASPIARSGGKLQTFYGPLGRKEVAVQMLIVPFAVALFGFSVLVIRLVVA